MLYKFLQGMPWAPYLPYLKHIQKFCEIIYAELLSAYYVPRTLYTAEYKKRTISHLHSSRERAITKKQLSHIFCRKISGIKKIKQDCKKIWWSEKAYLKTNTWTKIWKRWGSKPWSFPGKNVPRRGITRARTSKTGAEVFRQNKEAVWLG